MLPAVLQFQGIDIRKGGLDEATFEQSDFFAHLRTATVGRTLLTAASVESTQTIMLDNRSLLPIGEDLAAL